MEEIYPRFVSTWGGTGLPPKIHVSSPRSETDLRSHNDYVAAADLYPFLLLAREYSVDLDVMVEAKMKDNAMLKLVKDLSKLPNVKLLNEGSLELL